MAELKDKLINYDGLEFAIDEVMSRLPKGFDGEVSITTTFNINTGLTEPLDTTELDNLKPGLYKLNFGNSKGIAYISEGNQTIISNSLRVFCFRSSPTSKWNTYPLALINDTARSKTFTLSASKIYELINAINIPDTSNLITREEYDSTNQTINQQLGILSENDSTLFNDYENLEDRVAELEKKGATTYIIYGQGSQLDPQFTDTSEIDGLYDAGVYIVIVHNNKTNPNIKQTGILTITESRSTSTPYDVQLLELSNGRGYTRTATNKVWGNWTGWYEGRINDDKTSPSYTWSSYKLKNDYFTPINNSIDELNSKVDALELEAKIYTIYGIPTPGNPTFVDTTEINGLDKAGDYTVVVSGERSGVADLKQAGVLTVNVAPNGIITQILHYVNNNRYTRMRIGGTWGAWSGSIEATIEDNRIATNITWSSNKIDFEINQVRGDAANAQADVEELRNEFEESKLEAGKNIDITDKKINAKGYNFYSNGAFSEGEFEFNLDKATITAIDKANLTITLSQAPTEVVADSNISTEPNVDLSKMVRVTSLSGTTLKVAKWLDTFVVGANLYDIGGAFARGMFSHAEGISTAEGSWSHSEGLYNTVTGSYSHAEGYGNMLTGNRSHVEGQRNNVSTTYSHVEGYQNTVSNANYSHVEGSQNTVTATGSNNHMEGRNNTLGGASQTCHIEGAQNICNEGNMVHIEGNYNEFIGNSNMDGHIEGFKNKGWNGQHIEGWYNLPNSESAHYNADYPKYSHIIGNGTNESNRSNSYMLDYLGNAWYQKDVTAGGGTPDTPEHKLSLKADKTYVDEKIAEAGGGATYKAGRNIGIEDNVIGSSLNIVSPSVNSSGIKSSVTSYSLNKPITAVDENAKTITLDYFDAYLIYTDKLYVTNNTYGKLVNITNVSKLSSGGVVITVDEWLGWKVGDILYYDTRNNYSNKTSYIMLGQNGKVTGNNGMTFGNYNNVSIARGVAFGYYTDVKTNTDEFVCGSYNDSVPNQIFAVGNGSSTTNRSNALSLDKEGTLWAKEVTSGGSFTNPDYKLSDIGKRVEALEQGGGQAGDFVTRSEFELVENQVSGIEDSVSELDNKIQDVDHKADDIQNEVSELENRVTALEQQTPPEGDFVSKEEFDSTIEGMRTEFESLINDSIGQCDNKYETLYEEVNKINERIDNLQPSGGDFATKEELTQLAQDVTSGFGELGNRLQAEEQKSEGFSAAFDSVNEAINEINEKLDNIQPGGGSEVSRDEFNELKNTVNQNYLELSSGLSTAVNRIDTIDGLARSATNDATQALSSANSAVEVATSAVSKAEAAAETADKALTQLNGLTLWKGTEEEYESTDKDENTIYFII